MKLMKGAAIAVLAAVTLLLGVAAFAPAAFGQAPPDRQARAVRMFDLGGPQVGVTARYFEPGEAEKLKVPGGVLVEEVRPDTPAATAGLRPSDVIMEFDSERVRSLRQFARLVQETPPGRMVRTAVMRDGRRTEVSVAPTAAPIGEPGGLVDTARLRDRLSEFTARIPLELDVQLSATPSRLGATVQELTPDLAAYFGAKDGVLVAAVAANSPASQAGLRAGDVITAIDGRAVGSRTDLTRELREAARDGSVTLGIVRDKKESSIEAKIAAPPERRVMRPGRTI